MVCPFIDLRHSMHAGWRSLRFMGFYQAIERKNDIGTVSRKRRDYGLKNATKVAIPGGHYTVAIDGIRARSVTLTDWSCCRHVLTRTSKITVFGTGMPCKSTVHSQSESFGSFALTAEKKIFRQTP